MVERFEYQDGQANDSNNLNGQLVRHYDTSGRLETVRRDFDGNVEELRRRLNNRPGDALVDWRDRPRKPHSRPRRSRCSPSSTRSTA